MVGLSSNQFHRSAFSAPSTPHTAALPIKWVIGTLTSSSFRMKAHSCGWIACIWLIIHDLNSIFLSHQTSQQHFQPWLISQSNRNEPAEMISSEAQEVRSMRVRFTPSSKHKNERVFMNLVVLSAESCLFVLKRM